MSAELNEDRLQQLIEKAKGLSVVRIRNPIGVQSAARGYQFEPLTANTNATSLEIYGQPGGWAIFLEDGRFETGNGDVADSQLEHAVWGALAFGASQWRKRGELFWAINTGATALDGDSLRTGKLLRTRAPISEGSEKFLPHYISVESIRQLRFYV